MTTDALQSFLQQHQLPAGFLQQAAEHFEPLIMEARQRHKSPFVLGINGCQGSGKSTLAAWLQAVLSSQYQLRVVAISLDDFYLTRARRRQLAEDIHPLLATRGVPGTHDLPLAMHTFEQLLQGRPVKIPRFNKATDDRFPDTAWDAVEPVDIILFEGWCVGATAQPEEALKTPVNSLEANEDSDGRWRHHINQQLSENYPPLFDIVDTLVMLRAPSFSCVKQWRLQQEQKLAKKLQNQPQNQQSGLMQVEDIERFVMFFQRLTEHMLTCLPETAAHVYQLDETRQIINEIHRGSPN